MNILSKRLPDIKYPLFAVALVAMYAQFPFTRLSVFIVPSVCLYVLLSYKEICANTKNLLLCFSAYYVYIMLNIMMSAFLLHDKAYIARFGVILCVLPLAFLCGGKNRKRDDTLYRIALYATCLKVLFLIYIYILFLTVGDFVVFREYIRANELRGDIYASGGRLYIQLPGNAFIPFVFMIRFIKFPRFDVQNIYLLLGIFLCGNFAFLLGVFLFLAYMAVRTVLRKREWYIVTPCLMIMAVVLLFALLPFLNETIERKSIQSNPIRLDQAKVLLTGNYFTGNGIGNVITAKTKWRDYSGSQYFELQTLYIVNQIGLVGYAFFIFITFFALYRITGNGEILLLYFFYLFYTFWNPYCFDSTHIMAALLLLNTKIGGGYVPNKRAHDLILSRY